MNPPYSYPLVEELTIKFTEEHEAGNVPAGILLVNNCTDAWWCQVLLKRFAACFTDGRVPFERADGAKFATRQGQVFFYAGPDVEKFASRFESVGTVMCAVGQ